MTQTTFAPPTNADHPALRDHPGLTAVTAAVQARFGVALRPAPTSGSTMEHDIEARMEAIAREAHHFGATPAQVEDHLYNQTLRFMVATRHGSTAAAEATALQARYTAVLRELQGSWLVRDAAVAALETPFLWMSNVPLECLPLPLMHVIRAQLTTDRATVATMGEDTETQAMLTRLGHAERIADLLIARG